MNMEHRIAENLAHNGYLVQLTTEQYQPTDNGPSHEIYRFVVGKLGNSIELDVYESGSYDVRAFGDVDRVHCHRIDTPDSALRIVRKLLG
ncbi:MAG: hypothetical protein ACXWHZ_03730 [Usitatibacter sp.]